MIDSTVVDLSRFQFASTVMYHFIFVPLTLGLSFLIAIVLAGLINDTWPTLTLMGVVYLLAMPFGVRHYQKRAAAYATDADECRVFLAMLGIGPSKLEV